MLSQRTFWPAVLVRIRVLRDGLLLPSIRPSVPSVDPFIYSAAASTVISVLAWIVLLQLQYAHLEEEEKVMTAVVSTTSWRECCWRRGAVEWLCRSLPQAAFIPVSFLSTEKRESRSPGWVSEIDEDEPVAPASLNWIDWRDERLLQQLPWRCLTTAIRIQFDQCEVHLESDWRAAIAFRSFSIQRPTRKPMSYASAWSHLNGRHNGVA